MKYPSDITGLTFGYLKVLHKDEDRSDKLGYGRVWWLCQCQLCGNIVSVRRDHLVSHNTTSCGCIKSDSLSARMKEIWGVPDPVINNDYAEMFTATGMRFIVDAEDVPRLQQYRFRTYSQHNDTMNIIRAVSGRKVINIPTIIVDMPENVDYCVRFIDKSMPDYRKANLEFYPKGKGSTYHYTIRYIPNDPNPWKVRVYRRSGYVFVDEATTLTGLVDKGW